MEQHMKTLRIISIILAATLIIDLLGMIVSRGHISVIGIGIVLLKVSLVKYGLRVKTDETAIKATVSGSRMARTCFWIVVVLELVILVVMSHKQAFMPMLLGEVEIIIVAILVTIYYKNAVALQEKLASKTMKKNTELKTGDMDKTDV